MKTNTTTRHHRPATLAALIAAALCCWQRPPPLALLDRVPAVTRRRYRRNMPRAAVLLAVGGCFK